MGPATLHWQARVRGLYYKHQSYEDSVHGPTHEGQARLTLASKYGPQEIKEEFPP